jgi:hypothetical protein
MTNERGIAMRIARILDAYRTVPRLLVILYGVMCYQVSAWFMGLPDPTMAQGTFVSVIWGAAAAWFGLYCNSGWKWEDQ